MMFVLQTGIGVYAQKVNTLRLLQTANEKRDAGDYTNALPLYKTLLAIDSTDREYNYGMGVCYFHIKVYKNRALDYLIKAKGLDNDELYYYLGNCYHAVSEYDKALENFYSYQNANSEREHTFQEINDLIAKCLYAKYSEANPLTDIIIENMGSAINTEFADYAPLIPADESFMVFTSKRSGNTGGKKDVFDEYYEDIYISKKENNVWMKPSNNFPSINTPGNDGCTGLSADGQKMIIYRSNDSVYSGSFYTSSFDGTTWKAPTLLDVAINSEEFIETTASYAPDGESVFFSSDMPGGFGGRDLYMIKKLPNGNWGKPFNLGKNINTPYDEEAPFVHPKENMLFFSSQGHQNNMGGYDVFKASYDRDSGKFQRPQNIGFPINTANDDIFFVLNTNEDVGYFSSERKGGYGQADIYKVTFISDADKYTVIHCKLEDETGKAITGGKIKLTEPTSGKTIGAYVSNPYTGGFILIIEPSKQYDILLQAEGYGIYAEKYSYTKGNTTDKKFVLKK